MERVLVSLHKELNSLEDLVNSRVPRGEDYSRQWTLNRVVKKKAHELLAGPLDSLVSRLSGLLMTSADEGKVGALTRTRRRVEYGYSLARRPLSECAYKPGCAGSLQDRFSHAVAAAAPSAAAAAEKKKRRKGPNFQWVFESPCVEKAHALEPELPQAPARLQELAQQYVCRGVATYSECAKYVQFTKDWHGVEPGVQENMYAPEMRAMEAVYANPDGLDPWGYNISDMVRNTLLKPSEPLAFERIVRHQLNQPAVLIENDHDMDEFVDMLLNLTSPIDGQLPVFGIDVEFSQRGSFRGTVCLIQLSTHQRDYIIDPLRISLPMMQRLNDVTANPAILKVMHGIDHDVLWLQKDFGVYLVNVFDTFQAAKLLRVPGGFSLFNLVLTYCQVSLDKSQQSSDWRLRPLTERQILYAREDTHYLLNLFGQMRNQLLTEQLSPPITTRMGHNKMLNALHQTHLVAAKLVNYGPPDLSTKLDKTHHLVAGTNTPITNKLRYVSEVLFAWRDLKARDINEPPSHIVQDVPLYKALIKCINAPHNLKLHLPEVNEDHIRTMQGLMLETGDTLNDPEGVYLGGIGPTRKRTRPDEPPPPPTAATAPAVVETEPTAGIKRRKLVSCEVDRIKCTKDDNGLIFRGDEMPDDLASARVLMRGFYQAGKNSVVEFRSSEEGTLTRRKVRLSGPPWIKILQAS